jgi:hypothetical protein
MWAVLLYWGSNYHAHAEMDTLDVFAKQGQSSIPDKRTGRPHYNVSYYKEVHTMYPEMAIPHVSLPALAWLSRHLSLHKLSCVTIT